MKNKEEQLKKDKQIVASNIHLMQSYLGIKRKMSYKKAMSKTLEQLKKQYNHIVPVYQKIVKTHWIEHQLAQEFNMDDYEAGDFDFDNEVDARRKQLDEEQGYMYLGMFWQVIYTIDIYLNQYELTENKKRTADTSITQQKPDCLKRNLWYLTESKVEDEETLFAHRKWCADELTTEQLIEFLEEVDFTETCQTCGALTFAGLLPAISFSTYDYDVSHNAYVSPLMLDEQLNQLYMKYDKNNSWKSVEARDMQNIITNEIDKLMDLLLESTSNWKILPKAVRISAPMSLQFKIKEEK